jgi:hypothetical protein
MKMPLTALWKDHIHACSAAAKSSSSPVQRATQDTYFRHEGNMGGTKFVLVAGSGKQHLPERIVATSEQLGQALAQAGYGIVTGGWEGVDALVAESFARRLQILGRRSASLLRQVVKRGAEPSFAGGEVVSSGSEDDAWNLSIKLADAVVLVGGIGGTYETGRRARERGKPVLPLASTADGWRNDDARRFHAEMRTTWELDPIPGLTRDDFLELASPAPGVVSEVIRCLDKIFPGAQRESQAYIDPESDMKTPEEHRESRETSTNIGALELSSAATVAEGNTFRKVPKRFKVAFSFAGAQRQLVRFVAERVEHLLGRDTVFFDEWFEYYIAGDDADLRLQDIYLRRSDVVVLCVSGDYNEKPWTQSEYRAIRALQMQLASATSEALRLLPLRVGDGDVEGLLGNAIIPDVRRRSPDEAARLIVARWEAISSPLASGH